jgi:hypothetical protein
MKVVMVRQKDTPIIINDPKDNPVVDIENNHIEWTLEDGSLFILPSVETYYRFITEANLCFKDQELFIDKVFGEDTKITLVNAEYNDKEIKTVCENKYDEEEVYLLRG